MARAGSDKRLKGILKTLKAGPTRKLHSFQSFRPDRISALPIVAAINAGKDG